MSREDTQFKPGWKGGPGRPKGSKSLSTRLKEYLDGAKIGEEKLKRKQVADEVVEHLVKRATGRDSKASLQAIEMLFDRTEGKVGPAVDTSNAHALFDDVNDDDAGREVPSDETAVSG